MIARGQSLKLLLAVGVTASLLQGCATGALLADRVAAPAIERELAKRQAARTAVPTIGLPQATAAFAAPNTALPPNAQTAAIDEVLNATYAVVSGPVGQARDFDRMRELFTPDARLTSITATGLSGGTLEEYIVRSGPFLVGSGFTERQLNRRIEIYGNLAHAWSSYGGTFTRPDGGPGTVRGINSFQLVRQDDGRWLVQAILRQAETPDNSLPADMAGQ